MWLRRMASRRSTSMAAVAGWPGVSVPSVMRADVAAQARAGRRWCRAPRPRRSSVGDRAGVADLAAALGVERRAVEEDLDRCRRRPASDGEHPRLAVGVVGVADELGGAELLDELAVARRAGRRRAAVPLRAALARVALLASSRRRSRRCRRATPRSPAISCGQLEREAVGVVQQERGGARAASARRRRSSSSRIDRPVRSVWRKRSSSRVSTPTMKSRFLDDVGVGVAHHVDGRRRRASASPASRCRAGRRGARRGG